jgi:hypothetical protein
MRMKILAGLLIILFNSCLSFHDFRVDLGGNYTYHGDGKWKSIYPSQIYYDTHIYSEIVDYSFNERFIIAKQIPDYEYHKLFIESNYSIRYGIYCDFLKDSTSDKFMKETTPFIRNSIKADSSLYKLLKLKLVTNQNSTDDQEKIKTVLDSIFHSDPYYLKLFASKENYWIIDKQNNIRFGPLTKLDFERELIKMNINLKLKNK